MNAETPKQSMVQKYAKKGAPAEKKLMTDVVWNAIEDTLRAYYSDEVVDQPYGEKPDLLYKFAAEFQDYIKLKNYRDSNPKMTKVSGEFENLVMEHLGFHTDPGQLNVRTIAEFLPQFHDQMRSQNKPIAQAEVTLLDVDAIEAHLHTAITQRAKEAVQAHFKQQASEGRAK